ncbi:hypothetical protein HDU86_005001 [Geranomyces michiganensis]|nr:hypothetical protein HDU86_005001 [Geranomyces michiganensis]
MAELLKLLGDNPTDERLALVTKLIHEERQLLLLRQQKEQQQQEQEQAGAQPVAIFNDQAATAGAFYNNDAPASGFDPLLGPLTEQIGGLAFTPTGNGDTNNLSGPMWDSSGMQVDFATPQSGWVDVAHQTVGGNDSTGSLAVTTFDSSYSDFKGVAGPTTRAPHFFNPAPPFTLTGLTNLAGPSGVSGGTSYLTSSDTYAADDSFTAPVYEEDLLGDLGFLDTLLQPHPAAFAGFDDYGGASIPDHNPFVFYGTPAPQPVFGDDGLFHCAATPPGDIAEPAPRFRTFSTTSSSSSASPALSSSGSASSVMPYPSPDLIEAEVSLFPPYTQKQVKQPQQQQQQQQQRLAQPVQNPQAANSSKTRNRRATTAVKASSKSTTAPRPRFTKRIIPTLDLACRTCASPVGRAYLYTDAAGVERAVADVACRTCASWSDGRRVQQRSGGGTGGATTNIDARDTGWACDVCKRVAVVGGVREADGPLPPLVWRGVGFAVELNCASCLDKYSLCSDCGAGGKFRSGKWRPTQLFLPTRATCSLSHTRLTKTPKTTFVFVLPPAVTTYKAATGTQAAITTNASDIESLYATLPHDTKTPPIWALSQALEHCTYDVLARALAVPAWMEANAEIGTWSAMEGMLKTWATTGVAEVEGGDSRRVLICNGQRVERGRRRYVALKCVGGEGAWNYGVAPGSAKRRGDGSGGDVVLVPPRATSVLIVEWLVERNVVMPLSGSGEIYELLIDVLKRILADRAAAVLLASSTTSTSTSSSSFSHPPTQPPTPPEHLTRPLFVQAVMGAYIVGADRLTRQGLRAVERQRSDDNVPANGDASSSSSSSSSSSTSSSASSPWVFSAGARASDGEDEARALRGVLEWEDPVARGNVKAVYLGRVEEVVERWTREEEERKGTKTGKAGGSDEEVESGTTVAVGKKRTRK